jgi:hypothetical protein
MENTKGILIWQGDNYRQFYTSNFDYRTNSFLDKSKIIELMVVITTDIDGDIGPCYSLLYPNINIHGKILDKLIGMPYTHIFKLDLIGSYLIREYDVLLENNLRAKQVVGGDLYLENSTKLKNFKLLLQMHNILLNVTKLEPNRLYLLQDNKLFTTSVVTENIVSYILEHEELLTSITDFEKKSKYIPPSPVRV